MSRPSLVVVLAEDERHQRFVRRFLYRKGLSHHEIRMEPLPSGRGCGEQWVRDRYPIAVKAFRGRSGRAKTALIVAIDADKGDVEGRRRQLREALSQVAVSERAGDEAIVHLIPRRSIETWVLFLNGTPVDEETDYSREPEADRLIAAAAITFFEMIRVNAVPPNCIASLSAAIPEVRRF